MKHLREALVTGIALAVLAALPPSSSAEDARDIVRAAWEHWRGTTSQGQMTMTIHRPSWERSMSMKTWTRGQKHSLVRVTAPRKDAGNGTLMIDNSMWTFSPKVNRVMKVPSSMMGQSWMGSDFSNKDVSRADTIVDQYDHTLLEEEESDGHAVYVIQSIPHEDAAVVWGKEVLRVRDDNVLLKQDFYDQDGRLVKSLTSTKVGPMGGRVLALVQRMEKLESEGEWTEVVIESMSFDVEMPDSVFTRSNLRNPRD
jgi:outer membrane lipoprotein-sorting protein